MPYGLMLTLMIVVGVLVLRYASVALSRSNAIELLQFKSVLSIEPFDPIKEFESYGGFWSMYFDLRKWTFHGFYPGV